MNTVKKKTPVAKIDKKTEVNSIVNLSFLFFIYFKSFAAASSTITITSE